MRDRTGLGPGRHVHDGHGAAAIAKLEEQSPPDWVASELPSEPPAHEVTLTHGYWIDKTEVTNAAFAAFVDAGGYANQALWSARAGPGWRGRTRLACRSIARATSRSTPGCA